jgi:hypothetical protein
MNGSVTALRTSVIPKMPCNRISSLDLLNISDNGIGAMSQEAVEVGSPICLFFQPHGNEHGIDMYGRVVRCVSRNGGHELGIRFDIRPAA